MKSNLIQSFWHGKLLSDIELICINSFLKNGYDYDLYTYDTIINPPKEVSIKDANLILDQKEFKICTLYNKTSSSWLYGAFTDLFRYRLLYLNGGWWHDTDSCCVSATKLCDDYIFAKHHQPNNLTQICTGIIKLPPKSKLAEICFNEAYKLFHKSNGNVGWCKIGPAFFQDQIHRLNLNIKPYEPIAFCPIKYWETQKYLLSNYQISNDTICIHFYTSTWSDQNKLRIKNQINTLAYNLYQQYVLNNIAKFSKDSSLGIDTPIT